MGVGGDEGGVGVGDAGPAVESQSTAAEGGEGKGDADWMEKSTRARFPRGTPLGSFD